MKKFVSAALLIVLLIHLVGFYAYFVVRLGQIRQQMRETIVQLPASEFEIFVFALEEYEQVKVNDHEVKINGRMYDHSKPVFKDGMVTLYAKYDEAENNLIGFLEEVIETANQDHQKVPIQLISFLQLHFVTPLQLTLSLPDEKIDFSHGLSEKLILQFRQIDTPPPRA